MKDKLYKIAPDNPYTTMIFTIIVALISIIAVIINKHLQIVNNEYLITFSIVWLMVYAYEMITCIPILDEISNALEKYQCILCSSDIFNSVYLKPFTDMVYSNRELVITVEYAANIDFSKKSDINRSIKQVKKSLDKKEYNRIKECFGDCMFKYITHSLNVSDKAANGIVWSLYSKEKLLIINIIASILIKLDEELEMEAATHE